MEPEDSRFIGLQYVFSSRTMDGTACSCPDAATGERAGPAARTSRGLAAIADDGNYPGVFGEANSFASPETWSYVALQDFRWKTAAGGVFHGSSHGRLCSSRFGAEWGPVIPRAGSEFDDRRRHRNELD